MKKLFMLILILLAFSAKADYWTQKANFPGVSRKFGFAFAIGNKGYIGCGIDWVTVQNFSDCWEYDMVTNVWTQKADFTYPRYFLVGFSVGNFGYVGMGQGGIGTVKDLWQFDPVNNSWSQKANFPGTKRNVPISISQANFGFVSCGEAIGAYLNDLWQYDPGANSWTQKSSLPGVGRSNATGFSVGNKLYIGIGNDNSNHLDDFWEYDIPTDTWTQKANVNGLRVNGASFSIGNSGYLGLGQHGIIYYDLWQFDAALNQWIQKTNYLGPGGAYTFYFSSATKGYIALGCYQCIPPGEFLFNDLWEYTPDSATGIEKPSISNFSFQIFPNPAQDFINITYPTSEKEKINFTIANLNGKIILQTQSQSNDHQLSISIKDLSSGIYFVEATNGSKKTERKFVKN